MFQKSEYIHVPNEWIQSNLKSPQNLLLKSNHLLTDFDIATGKVVAVYLVANGKCFWDVVILQATATEKTGEHFQLVTRTGPNLSTVQSQTVCQTKTKNGCRHIWRNGNICLMSAFWQTFLQKHGIHIIIIHPHNKPADALYNYKFIPYFHPN